MKDKKELSIEHLKAIDERINKEYPKKKAVPLGKMIEGMRKKKVVNKKNKKGM